MGLDLVLSSSLHIRQQQGPTYSFMPYFSKLQGLEVWGLPKLDVISLFLTAVEGSFFPELVLKYFGIYRFILVDVKD